MIFGTFDVLHPGHEFFIREATKYGETTVVVARSENVKKLKGRAPRQNEEERMQRVQSAFPETKVILGDPEDFLVAIREEKPDLLLLGYDQKLPPGVRGEELPRILRAVSYKPEIYKSSLNKNDQ